MPHQPTPVFDDVHAFKLSRGGVVRTTSHHTSASIKEAADKSFHTARQSLVHTIDGQVRDAHRCGVDLLATACENNTPLPPEFTGLMLGLTAALHTANMLHTLDEVHRD